MGSFFVRRWQLLGSCYNTELQRDIMARGQRRVFLEREQSIGIKKFRSAAGQWKTGDSPLAGGLATRASSI